MWSIIVICSLIKVDWLAACSVLTVTVTMFVLVSHIHLVRQFL
jgi:hypothetical protein